MAPAGCALSEGDTAGACTSAPSPRPQRPAPRRPRPLSPPPPRPRQPPEQTQTRLPRQAARARSRRGTAWASRARAPSPPVARPRRPIPVLHPIPPPRPIDRPSSPYSISMSQHQEYAVLPQHAAHLPNDSRQQQGGVVYEKEQLDLSSDTQAAVPSICGMPLKYVSLVTLAVQNALLTLIMHYSRVSAAPSHTYSAASAVLLTELLKGSISLTVAFLRLDYCSPSSPSGSSLWNPRVLLYRFRRLGKEVFRPDCWKLSIPAILYVIQNNLQFVAVSNLEAATFQVSYQMKILTTAAFSVVMLRKKLSPTKWLALLFLAIGVGVVQIQNGSSSGHTSGGSGHDMNAFKGFMAVVMACFTSGLAGVYFEMVLKNSQADLWVRNVQLSLFSLLPALVPILFSDASPARPSPGWLQQLFANFGAWAWATVLIQVLGGLLTALVIKYADNILKGFATSLSIVISFLALRSIPTPQHP
ncbi:hypothetical protein NUW54_g3662 [Trametes sanguinea]|uniref:Uncharacterized protein n=1 Tax=Trametes sanguinea TaxID=158606 RepID=A0ACC1Q0D3_9APHY|nr:hypothetical protein NUW54_g3662 [Trametes sanguinea]